jgi:hypothetical protein
MQRINEISYPMNMTYMNTLVEMALEDLILWWPPLGRVIFFPKCVVVVVAPFLL